MRQMGLDGTLCEARIKRKRPRTRRGPRENRTCRGRRRREEWRRSKGKRREAGCGKAWRCRTGRARSCQRVFRAAGDVAAGEIGVPLLEPSGAHDVAGEDAIAEAGGEPLDLRPRCGWSYRRSSRTGCGSRPRGCACRPARGWDRRAYAARRGRRGGPGCRPRATACSEAATSAAAPPTWTVPARRQASSSHGTGRIEGVVDLEDPGARGGNARGRRRSGRGAGRRRVAGIAMGMTSRRMARAGGKSARERTGASHSISPPASRRQATSAEVMRLRAAAREGPADSVAHRRQARCRSRTTRARKTGGRSARQARRRARARARPGTNGG